MIFGPEASRPSTSMQSPRWSPKPDIEERCKLCYISTTWLLTMQIALFIQDSDEDFFPDTAELLKPNNTSCSRSSSRALSSPSPLMSPKAIQRETILVCNSPSPLPPLPLPPIPIPSSGATPPWFEGKYPQPYIPVADLDDWEDAKIEVGTITF